MLVLGVVMGGRAGVPVRVRRVSSELRELRLRSGLGAEEVATALGMSMSKLSRMESGQRGLYADDVSALLGLYRVPAPRREELLALVRNGADRNWWQVQDGRLPAMWEDIIAFEKQATAIRNYETMFIPGLLQTPEYAAAIIKGTDPELEAKDVDLLVEARLKRQALLCRAEAPEFEALIEQSVLERPVGTSDVRLGQLRRLVDAAASSSVRVMPSSLGAHPGMEGPLVLLEFGQDPSLVYLENRSSSAFLEQADQVMAAKQSLRRLRKLALSPEDSLRFFAQLTDGLT